MKTSGIFLASLCLLPGCGSVDQAHAAVDKYGDIVRQAEDEAGQFQRNVERDRRTAQAQQRQEQEDYDKTHGPIVIELPPVVVIYPTVPPTPNSMPTPTATPTINPDYWWTKP